jgi:hypothetical protein
VKRVTLDSNVYVSGFVFGGKPKRVLEMAIDGEIEVAVSDPIIQEVRRHLLGKFGWSEPRAAEAVESIAEFAKHVTPTETIDTVPTGWSVSLPGYPGNSTAPVPLYSVSWLGDRLAGSHSFSQGRTGLPLSATGSSDLSWRLRACRGSGADAFRRKNAGRLGLVRFL